MKTDFKDFFVYLCFYAFVPECMYEHHWPAGIQQVKECVRPGTRVLGVVLGMILGPLQNSITLSHENLL